MNIDQDIFNFAIKLKVLDKDELDIIQASIQRAIIHIEKSIIEEEVPKTIQSLGKEKVILDTLLTYLMAIESSKAKGLI